MPVYTFEMPVLGSAPIIGTNYYAPNATFAWTGETMSVSVYDDDSFGFGDDAPLDETDDFPTVVSVNGGTTHEWVGQSFIIGGVRDLSTDGSWDIGILKIGGEWVASTFVQLSGADVTVLPSQTYLVTGGDNPPGELFPAGVVSDSFFNDTQDVIDKYGELGLAAKLSMAAYRLAADEPDVAGINHGIDVDPSNKARYDQFEELRGDLHFLTGAELGTLVGTQTSTDFPEAGLRDGVYTNLNAAAILARTDDALFISFRGTNDNNQPEKQPPDTPDGHHWAVKGPHWDLFEPLMTALKTYLGNGNGISNVYVSGHSLGGAMVEAFMEEMKDTSTTHFHATAFASPGYGIGILGDTRISNIWIEDDPILGIPTWGGDNDGDMNTVFHNLFDEGLLDKNDDVESKLVHRPDYYVEFVEFMKSQGIGEAQLSGKALHGIDYDRFYMDAVPTSDKMSIDVGKGGTTLEGTWKREVILGGRGSDTLIGHRGKDYLDGGGSQDFLNGGRGKDFLYGKKGDDFLTGGRGADLFVFKTDWGVDTITDFDAKGRVHDTIDLSELVSIRGWQDLRKHHLSVDGNDVVIDGENGDSVVLRDIDRFDLDKGDFLF